MRTVKNGTFKKTINNIYLSSSSYTALSEIDFGLLWSYELNSTPLFRTELLQDYQHNQDQRLMK